MEWFKKMLDQIKGYWSKWTLVQKIIFFSVIGAVIIGIVLLFSFNSSPSMAAVFRSPITDEIELSDISNRLDIEGIYHTVTEDGRIYVRNDAAARQARSIIVREGLQPNGSNPFDILNTDSWTTTQWQQDQNLRRALMEKVELHIEALDYIDRADVTLVLPEDAIFEEDQDPTTASIVITPQPGYEVTKRQVKGLERMIQYAVPGLLPDNITILDSEGNTLNNWDMQEPSDMHDLAEMQIETTRDFEKDIQKGILSELTPIFGEGKVRVSVSADLNFDQRKTNERLLPPIVLQEDNPATPFDESEGQKVLSVLISEERNTESYRGDEFNPEGPPGTEPNTPPSYVDLQGAVAEYDRDQQRVNYDTQETTISTDETPWAIDRVSVSVAVDGTWIKLFNDDGTYKMTPDRRIEREYVPVSDEKLKAAEEYVRGAMGYNINRSDQLEVKHLQFDRSGVHAAEDKAYWDEMQMRQVVLIVLIGIAVLLLVIIAFRLFMRYREKQKRLREEELARQHQAMREAALRSAEEESAEVQMSVEERARLEMQENAINMAREHPEDVAQLIRTWLLEE